MDSVSIQVTKDGFLSFGREVTTVPSGPFPGSGDFLVAPFLTKSNLDYRPAEVSYEVHNSSTYSSALEWVSRFITQNELTKFSGNWMIVVAWKNLPQVGELTSKVCFVLHVFGKELSSNIGTSVYQASILLVIK